MFVLRIFLFQAGAARYSATHLLRGSLLLLGSLLMEGRLLRGLLLGSLLLGGLLLGMAATSQASEAKTPTDAAPATVIEVTDARGKQIRLAQPAQRIIALAPHIVENVYSAGAGDKLVAAVNYSNYPEAALKLPHVGGYHAVNYEEILAHKPDLVLVWMSGQGPQVAAQLERLGLTVYMNELRTLEDIASEVITIGKLAGTEAIARERAHAWQQQLNTLRDQYRNASALGVFYQVWNEPLQTLNGQHLVSDVIALCGGVNIFAEALSIAPKINEESVISRNPDVIIASGMGEERPDWLDTWKRYPKLKAVAQDNLFFVPPDLIQRHTLRILQGTELICSALQSARKQ